MLQMGLLGRKQGIERPSCLLSEAGQHNPSLLADPKSCESDAFKGCSQHCSTSGAANESDQCETHLVQQEAFRNSLPLRFTTRV
jgi:hypothetical protein